MRQRIGVSGAAGIGGARSEALAERRYGDCGKDFRRPIARAGRTWVILTEAAEGGWGIADTAFGKQEFIALAEKAKRIRP